MNKEHTNSSANQASSVIEDLTLNEATATAVKGGPGYLLEIDGIKGESEPRSASR